MPKHTITDAERGHRKPLSETEPSSIHYQDASVIKREMYPKRSRVGAENVRTHMQNLLSMG